MGIASCVSRVSVSTRATRCTSTTGAWPLTVTVSSSAPTASVASTVSVKSPGSVKPSRIWVEKPTRVKVTT